MKIDKANEIVLVMKITDACFLLGMMDVPLGCFFMEDQSLTNERKTFMLL